MFFSSSGFTTSVCVCSPPVDGGWCGEQVRWASTKAVEGESSVQHVPLFQRFWRWLHDLDDLDRWDNPVRIDNNVVEQILSTRACMHTHTHTQSKDTLAVDTHTHTHTAARQQDAGRTGRERGIPKQS